ncbi:hypothetical protein FA743_00065 [Paracoccus gahaiensis]|uniref:Uncharacterized protein n=1 Tax=Paracoccus gahaiensis TaxID=1706839 RepID=A0A4U0RG44_9RHOB|nr:hypothetical protein [Paracoccus gahaiensis]TJZ93712.1 hypothetical protein FA743_00065 [Paracoccus gahaiensis]
MHNLMWLVRAARWVRNPPSAKMVMMVFGIIAAALVIAGVEWMGWWPEWATMERQPRFPR